MYFVIVNKLRGGTAASKYRDVFQEREDPEDDHDDAADLLGAAVDRQHVDQIEDEDDDEEGDKRTDEKRPPKTPVVAALVFP